MSIGFRFTTLIRDQEVILKTIKNLSTQFAYEFHCGGNWARVVFSHMGDLDFSFEKKKLFSKIQMTGEANTSLVGAGFHVAAIDFVDALVIAEKLKIEMEDETDYYTHRDFAKMRSEHFYNWLNLLVEHCERERSRGQDSLENLCLCWDLNQYLPFDMAGTVVTPFGRFEIQALVEQAEQQGVGSFAQEFFIWNERVKDARFYRNSALTILWEDCYFQPGSRSEVDEMVNESIIKLLEKAAQLDSSLPFPKEEYGLLCQLQGHTPIDLSDTPAYQSKYLIGYRRGIVYYRLGNASIAIHGRFLLEENENGTLWYDNQEDNWHNLRVSAFAIKEGEAQFSERLFKDMEDSMVEFTVGDGNGRAAFVGQICPEDGSSYYQSIGEIICGKQTTLITASYQNSAEKTWALELFKNIKTFKEQE